MSTDKKEKMKGIAFSNHDVQKYTTPMLKKYVSS